MKKKEIEFTALWLKKQEYTALWFGVSCGLVLGFVLGSLVVISSIGKI